MPKDELCSPCYVNLHRMMQSSPYSVYHNSQESDYLQARLKYIYSQCPVPSGSTAIKDPQYIPVEEDPVPCFTDVTYTIKAGDTCDTIALSHSVSSGSLQATNSETIYNCTDLPPNRELCIPLTCDKLYVFQDTDTCWSIETENGIGVDNLPAYNPWINWFCDNLVPTVWMRGRILCLSPPGGFYNVTNPIPGVVVAPSPSTSYAPKAKTPPANATLAEGTTRRCGKWYTVSSADDTCVEICTQTGITADLFRAVNPSLKGNSTEACTGLLQQGLTYCVGPVRKWDTHDDY